MNRLSLLKSIVPTVVTKSRPRFLIARLWSSLSVFSGRFNVYHNRILYSGEFETENYDVWLEHGHLTGIDNARHEAVAIWHKELCGRATLIGSLQLLDQGLEIAEE